MTKEAAYQLLQDIAATTASGSERKRLLREACAEHQVSSDTVRSRARRWAVENNLDYPRLRRRLNEGRKELRASKKADRNDWTKARLDLALKALAEGATWAGVASVIAIASPEAASQWVRRHAKRAGVQVPGGRALDRRRH